MDHALVARLRKPKIPPIEDIEGLPSWHSGEEPACQCKRHRDEGLVPGSGRPPGVRNGSPLQYSCLENPTDRGSWQATVHGVTKSQDMTEQERDRGGMETDPH